MWRLWTRGFGPRDWWHWVKIEFTLWVAWHLPRRIAYWAFIRVYSAGFDGAPGDDFLPVCTAWEEGAGR